MNSIHLPCGKSAIVGEFDGSCQEILSNEKLIQSGDWYDLLLGRVLIQLDQRRGMEISPSVILHMPTGSRLRVLIEARRLTYGNEVALTWHCIECGEPGKKALDLSHVDEVPYPEGLPEETFTTKRGIAFTVGWGSGETERAFIKGRAKRLWGNLDEMLTRVTAINDQMASPREILRQSASVLDEVRSALRSMTPCLDLDAHTPPLPNPWGLPQGGPRSRIQVECNECGKRMYKPLEGAPDFLFRALQQQVSD